MAPSDRGPPRRPESGVTTASSSRDLERRIACEHADRCAGCALIHLSYGEQLEQKREQVRAALALYPSLLGVEVMPCSEAHPPTGYRVRAKLMVSAETKPGGGRGLPTIGLFCRTEAPDHEQAGRRHHAVVDIPGCQALSPTLLHVTSRLRTLLESPPANTGDCLVPEALGGQLCAFDLRETSDGERRGVLLTLVLGRDEATEIQRASTFDAASTAIRTMVPEVIGVAVNFRQTSAPQVLGPKTHVVWGPNLVRDRVASVYHLATYGSFVQAHRSQAAAIVDRIATELVTSGSEARVLDLYAGSGAMSISLAARGAHLTLVE